MKRSIILVILLALCLLMYGCGKSDAAIKFENMVKSIGTVTLDSEDTIVAAEQAYAALTFSDKEDVFESYKALAQIRFDYNAKVAEEEARIKAEEDQRLAKQLTEEIDQLGTITLDSFTDIEQAMELYNSLSAEAKALVPNTDILIDAAIECLSLRQAECDKLITKYSKNFESGYDGFLETTWYRHKSFPSYINERCYIAPAINVQNNDVRIGVLYNYTGDSWIFWEKATLLVDGVKYELNAGYNNITRDNDYGDVWEYYEYVSDPNIPMNHDLIQLLTKIAESEETIIRFQGDSYHYDYTVKKTDKQIISDTLLLYEAILDKNIIFAGLPGYTIPES